MDYNLSDSSKEEIKQNLTSLYDKLTEKMVELGNIIRSSDAPNKELTEHVNLLKKDRFALRQAMDTAVTLEDAKWGAFKEEAERLTYETRNRMETEIPHG